jgi:small-conductance mechanosensitive channel
VTLVWAADPFGDFVDRWSDELLASIVVLIGALVVWWLFRRLGHRSVDRMISRRDDDAAGTEDIQRINTLWRVLQTVVAVLVIAVVVFTIMMIWGLPIGPLVAVGGAVGVAVGFGAQSFVKDVIAGFLIVAEHQFSIGDVVRIADVSGEVETIRLRTTVLRDLDGNVHHVPNGAITVASNYTQKYSQVVVDVNVAYGQDIDEAIAVISDELGQFAADPEWEAYFMDAPQLLGVDALAESSVKVRALLRVDPAARWTARREFLRRIKNRLDREGIEIPYQHLTVVMEGQPPAGGAGELNPPE